MGLAERGDPAAARPGYYDAGPEGTVLAPCVRVAGVPRAPTRAESGPDHRFPYSPAVEAAPGRSGRPNTLQADCAWALRATVTARRVRPAPGGTAGGASTKFCSPPEGFRLHYPESPSPARHRVCRSARSTTSCRYWNFSIRRVPPRRSSIAEGACGGASLYHRTCAPCHSTT